MKTFKMTPVNCIDFMPNILLIVNFTPTLAQKEIGLNKEITTFYLAFETLPNKIR